MSDYSFFLSINQLIVECLLCHTLGIKPVLTEKLSNTTGKNELAQEEEEEEEEQEEPRA